MGWTWMDTEGLSQATTMSEDTQVWGGFLILRKGAIGI